MIRFAGPHPRKTAFYISAGRHFSQSGRDLTRVQGADLKNIAW
jgi:hypothetical protein